LAGAEQDSTRAGNPQARSVILLWLWGGPSQHETWDPKPNAASPIRGPFQPICTRTPGLTISELLPQSAEVANLFAVIRSMRHDQSDHNVAGTIALTGNVAGAKASGGVPFPGTVRPTLGSMVAKFSRSRPGHWPPFMAIGPVCQVSMETLRGQSAGVLGPSRDPFRVGLYSFEDGFQLPGPLNLPTEINIDRLENRQQLLKSLEAVERRFDAAADVQRLSDFQAQALALVTSPLAKKAFDLESEPESLRDRYGRTSYGQSLILARRLVEAKVPFVQVNWSSEAEDEQQGGDGGWDLHYRLFERMQERYCPIFDRAFSALLTDLSERGLLKTTLVLAMGEFGRSPKISPSLGREHWPYGYSMALAGGGVRGGQVYGASDRDGGYPKDLLVHPANIHATVLELLGVNRIALNEMGLSLDAEPVHGLL
jgi:hypothetical protein